MVAHSYALLVSYSAAWKTNWKWLSGVITDWHIELNYTQNHMPNKKFNYMTRFSRVVVSAVSPILLKVPGTSTFSIGVLLSVGVVSTVSPIPLEVPGTSTFSNGSLYYKEQPIHTLLTKFQYKQKKFNLLHFELFLHFIKFSFQLFILFCLFVRFLIRFGHHLHQRFVFLFA